MHYGLSKNGELFIVVEAQPRPQCFPLRKWEEIKKWEKHWERAEVGGGIPVATPPLANLSDIAKSMNRLNSVGRLFFCENTDTEMTLFNQVCTLLLRNLALVKVKFSNSTQRFI